MNAPIITPETFLSSLPRFADDRGRTLEAGSSRVYFYYGNRREMVGHPLNGATLVGRGAMVAHRGLHVEGTARSLEVVIYAEGWRYGKVGPETFPSHNVAAKLWWSWQESEWAMLAKGDGTEAKVGNPIPSDIPDEALVTRQICYGKKTELRGLVFSNMLRKGLVE